MTGDRAWTCIPGCRRSATTSSSRASTRSPPTRSRRTRGAPPGRLLGPRPDRPPHRAAARGARSRTGSPTSCSSRSVGRAANGPTARGTRATRFRVVDYAVVPLERAGRRRARAARSSTSPHSDAYGLTVGDQDLVVAYLLEITRPSARQDRSQALTTSNSGNGSVTRPPHPHDLGRIDMRAGLLALPTKGRVALAFAGLALGAAILLGGASPGTAAPSGSGHRHQRGLRRRGQHRRHAAPTTSSSCATAARGGQPRRLVGAVPLAGATGAWQVTPLTGSIAAGGNYLVAEAAGAGGTQELPRRRPPARSPCPAPRARSRS